MLSGQSLLIRVPLSVRPSCGPLSCQSWTSWLGQGITSSSNVFGPPLYQQLLRVHNLQMIRLIWLLPWSYVSIHMVGSLLSGAPAQFFMFYLLDWHGSSMHGHGCHQPLKLQGGLIPRLLQPWPLTGLWTLILLVISMFGTSIQGLMQCARTSAIYFNCGKLVVITKPCRYLAPSWWV